MKGFKRYKIPRIENIVREQSKNQISSVLNMKHSYHQMLLAKDSQLCTSMRTSFGTYITKVMPMGGTNCNTSFQRVTEWILRNDYDIAIPFVDDVIIGSERATWEKAALFVEKVDLAGHIVGHGRPWPTSGKGFRREQFKATNQLHRALAIFQVV